MLRSLHVVLTGCALLAVSLAVAVGDTAPGHSDHGEAFNDGPRQAAYLMGTTGDVHFAITTKNPLAQKFFNQGVGQLHGFWYFEAERSFRQVAALDKECAMAYWGMAAANVNNNKRAAGFIAEAVKRKSGTTRREQMHIDALDAYTKAGDTKDKEKLRQRSQAYFTALEKIILDHPDDVETKAMLALKMWQDMSNVPLTSRLTVDALLDQVFAASPMHPAHHYRIHLWNNNRDQRALESAARCGQSAPGIAHMWHMPGHTYSALKRYEDAAWQQEASARVDHAHMMRDRVLPDQIHNFAHNNEWLIRNFNFLGQITRAVDLARNMIELPQHPKYNTFDGKKKGSAQFGRQRLLETLENYELWRQIIAHSQTAYLPMTEAPREQARLIRALALAHYQLGEIEPGDKHLADLEARLAKEPKPAAKKESKGEKKDEAGSSYDKKEPALREQLASTIDELRAYRLAAERKYAEAVEALKSVKNADASQLARLQILAGRSEDAVKTAREQVKRATREVEPLATLVDILWRAQQRDEALKAMEELRKISGHIDLDAGSPVFARLAPVAEAMKLPKDWRVKPVPAKDVGERPSLDALGPFRWQPLPAPVFSLPDSSGSTQSLSAWKGRPVVVIFYLGYECLHCVQQIRAFAPLASEFADAGIDLVAISTDNVENLHKAVEGYGSKFPFPLLSDPSMTTFRAYRAFDDFEAKPLHGTFLIDPQGLVRWQDISYEPFMEGKFLLAEARRLLAQKN